MRAFVTGQDISLKMAKITNFQVYLNFFDAKHSKDYKVRFEDLTQDLSIDEVDDYEIRALFNKF